MTRKPRQDGRLDTDGGTEQPRRVPHEAKSQSGHEIDKQRLPHTVSLKTSARTGTDAYPSQRRDAHRDSHGVPWRAAHGVPWGPHEKNTTEESWSAMECHGDQMRRTRASNVAWT